METVTTDQDYSAPALVALADVLHNTGAQLRKLGTQGAEQSSINLLLTSARGALAQLCAEYIEQDTEANPIATLGELAGRYWDGIKERKAAASTGVPLLDDVLGGGIQPGRLMVLLGAPGSGKTTLANQIAEHIASAGRPVVYVTSEDPPAVLLAKTLARLGMLDYGAVLQGRKGMHNEINAALAALAERQSAQRLLYVHDTGRLALDTIQETARKHFATYSGEQGGPGLLVIDYLQRFARSLMVGAWRDRRLDLRNAVTLLTEELRRVAIELDCTILALGSQSRASGYSNGDSALMSAKESGDIEYTTDVLAILGNADISNKQQSAGPGHQLRSLQIAKNRQGELKTLTLDWLGARQQFSGVKP